MSSLAAAALTPDQTVHEVDALPSTPLLTASCHHNWPVKDFNVQARDLSLQIAQHARALAAYHDRGPPSWDGHHDKKQLAREILSKVAPVSDTFTVT